MPAMRRPNVVLPAPDGPTTARCSPASHVEADAVQDVGVVVRVVDLGDHDALIDGCCWRRVVGAGLGSKTLDASEGGETALQRLDPDQDRVDR